MSIAVPDMRLLRDSSALIDSTGVWQWRNRRPRSAQIDWSHPLSRGIVAYVLGPNCDIASRMSTDHNKVCDTGIGFKYKDGGAYIRYKPQRISTQFTVTMLMPRYPDVASSSPRPLWNFGRSGSRIYGEVIAVLDHGTLRVGFWDGEYKIQMNDNQGPINTGCGMNICIAFDQRKGIYGASSAYPTAHATNSSQSGSLRADIGEIGSDSRDGRALNEITAFIVHNRALNIAEVHRMSRNPYQMLRGM